MKWHDDTDEFLPEDDPSLSDGVVFSAPKNKKVVIQDKDFNAPQRKFVNQLVVNIGDYNKEDLRVNILTLIDGYLSFPTISDKCKLFCDCAVRMDPSDLRAYLNMFLDIDINNVYNDIEAHRVTILAAESELDRM